MERYKLKLKKDLPGFIPGDIFFHDDDDGWRARLKNSTAYIENWMYQFLEENYNDPVWFEKLPVEPELPQSWEELGKLEGYWIDTSSKILQVGSCVNTEKSDRNIFKTRKQAESALAYAQLTQLMAVYNDGWEPDWSDSDERKCTIERQGDYIISRYQHNDFKFLSFKDQETAEAFMEAPEIEKLIRQFYMIEGGDE